MRHRLKIPPMQALKAFESTARLGSLIEAGRELNLTQGAIGHQVRALEDQLGVTLFERTGRGLLLTDNGVSYADKVRKALHELAEASNEIGRSHAQARLSISVLPSFASRWLVARIGSFQQQHPNIALFLHTGVEVVELGREPVDLCIRFGSGPWEGLWCERLMTDRYYPVCSPAFLRHVSIGEPRDILDQTLLSCSDEPWGPWFAEAGLAGVQEPDTVKFSDAANLLDAARNSLGIALARHTLAEEDIVRGNLVRLLDISVPCPMAYYLVCTDAMVQTTKVQQFRSWIWSEIANCTD